VSGITAAASIIAERDARGATRLPVLSSQVPLVLRRTADAVYVVGGAAGPLGGDDLTLTIEVREGATLRIRTAAASVALPDRDGRESVLRVKGTVGAGARLEILPEPVVIADGARHRLETRVSLAADAALVLREMLILGRHGESGGRCVSRIRADLGGTPLLRHELSVDGTDAASLGPAILAGQRAVGSVLIVEPGWSEPPASAAAAGVAVMPLAGPAVLVTALAPDALTLRERVDWALSQVILDGRFVLGGRAFIFRQTGGGSMSQTARSPAAAATASGCPAPSVRW
jgi:urease accessory protein